MSSVSRRNWPKRRRLERDAEQYASRPPSRHIDRCRHYRRPIIRSWPTSADVEGSSSLRFKEILVQAKTALEEGRRSKDAAVDAPLSHASCSGELHARSTEATGAGHSRGHEQLIKSCSTVYEVEERNRLDWNSSCDCGPNQSRMTRVESIPAAMTGTKTVRWRRQEAQDLIARGAGGRPPRTTRRTHRFARQTEHREGAAVRGAQTRAQSRTEEAGEE
jgi:hypothetical protein